MLRVDSNSSPSSSSSDDLPKIKKIRVDNFMASIRKYSEDEFLSHFRITRPIAYSLINKYKNAITRYKEDDKEETSPKKRFFVTLWYLANTDTFENISRLFDISVSSTKHCIVCVTDWLVRCAHLYIKWPKEEAEQETITNRFQQIKGFPHVLGAINIIHIQIPKPKENFIVYCNRKKYYSVLLQGVVGPNCKFFDIHVGEPGSMLDIHMLRNSELYTRCSENQQSLIKSQRVILGDLAFPCLSWLIPPFRERDNLFDSQKAFNKKHFATQMVVEQAFNILKTNFRRITKFEHTSIDLVVNCTIAACVLHNICIEKNPNHIITTAHRERLNETTDKTSYDAVVNSVEENTIRRQELLEEMYSD